MLYVLTILFIVGFEFGTGPILWVYIAEVCNDTATSIATVANQIGCLIVSIYTVPMLNYFEGYTWLICGILSIIQLVYLKIYMKETAGLTKE